MASIGFALDPGKDLIAGGRHGVGRDSTEQSTDNDQIPRYAKSPPTDSPGEPRWAGHLVSLSILARISSLEGATVSAVTVPNSPPIMIKYPGTRSRRQRTRQESLDGPVIW